LALHRLDCLASHGGLDLYDFVREHLASLDDEQLRPPPLINGHDLIELGYSPGRSFKGMLAEIEDRQLAGDLQTREEALRVIDEQFPLKSEAERSQEETHVRT
jgi:poly(A) polymerase